jgi:hypothetical protein
VGDTGGGGGYTGDGDLISDAVELNPPNARLYHFSTTVKDADPSRALGTPSQGTLSNGINLPDVNASYYHFLGFDATDTDDWGTLRLLNVGEAVAYDWGDAYRICYGNTQLHPTRFGIGDMSKGSESTRTFGGSWLPDHVSHQNGLDMDVRYLRTDRAEAGIDLQIAADQAFYDAAATADLISCFLGFKDVVLILVDMRYTGIDFSATPQVVNDPDHHNHFHVRIADPDGTANSR